MRPVSSILALSLTLAASSALAAPGSGTRAIPFASFGARAPAPVLAPFGRNTPTVLERLRPGINMPIGTPLRAGLFRSTPGGYSGAPGLGGNPGRRGSGGGCDARGGYGGCRDGGYRGPGLGYGYSGLGYGYDLGQGAAGGYQVAPPPSAGVSGIRPAPVLPPTIYVVGADGSAGEPRREASARSASRAGGPLVIRVP